jgi:prepilin-type N-terminal cleavage/methylation domain-containing protein/prepilin-type processing-associated H-X9-DG protein
MRKTPSSSARPRGFTLVEILVVITISLVLAAIAFTMGPKMLKRGDAARSVQNMRQIGPLLLAYTTENNGRLPAPRADVPDGKGGFNQLHWHETLMLQVYPNTNPDELRKEDWWVSNKPFLRNPLCTADTKPYPWAWWNPGYAINLQIGENLGLSSGDWNPGKGGPQSLGIPLASIPDPARTPIVATRGDWHFNFTPDQLKDPNLTPFLVDGKMPILFVDGHVESMLLAEYASRELYNQPPKK